MFTGLSSDELLYLFVGAGMACFFVGNAMDAVLGRQGFGVAGNMVVLLAGLVIGIKLIGTYSMSYVPAPMVVPTSIAIAFAILFTLALCKKVLERL